MQAGLLQLALTPILRRSHRQGVNVRMQALFGGVLYTFPLAGRPDHQSYGYFPKSWFCLGYVLVSFLHLFPAGPANSNTHLVVHRAECVTRAGPRARPRGPTLGFQRLF